MTDCDIFYDSDEEVGIGPITFREEIASLKHKNHPRDPRRTRRDTAFGRLQRIVSDESSSTEYFTADSSTDQKDNMMTDSSLEEVDASINEAVGKIIRTLDNETVIELSDSEDDKIVNISSTSSSSLEEIETKMQPTIPKFKIDSPTSNLRQPNILIPKDLSTLSETEFLQNLSSLQLSMKGLPDVPTDDESLLLRSAIDKESDFADDEQEEDKELQGYKTAVKNVSAELNNEERSKDIDEDGIEKYNSDDDNKVLVEESNSLSPSTNISDKNGESHVDDLQVENEELDDKNRNDLQTKDENKDKFNSTLDRIDFILNSGSQIENKDFVTPKRIVPAKTIKSAPNTPLTNSNRKGHVSPSPFKVPTKIPLSLRKDPTHIRPRFDNIKSPVAHYIKNSPSAPIIRNQLCPEVPLRDLIVFMEDADPNVIWPKLTLPEKQYNRGEVHVISEYKSKVLKLPANIEAITVNMGTLQRHIRRPGVSRLPVTNSSDFLDLHDTFSAQTPRDVSLISEQKIIID